MAAIVHSNQHRVNPAKMELLRLHFLKNRTPRQENTYWALKRTFYPISHGTVKKIPHKRPTKTIPPHVVVQVNTEMSTLFN